MNLSLIPSVLFLLPRLHRPPQEPARNDRRDQEPTAHQGLPQSLAAVEVVVHEQDRLVHGSPKADQSNAGATREGQDAGIESA